MKGFLTLITVLIVCSTAWSQNEDAAGSILINPVSMVAYANLTTSQCGTTTYNLGASTSSQIPAGISGVMGNDVWFHFVAVSEVAKIKVCNPSGFNVALELWNSTATGTPIAAANANNAGAKEVICANSLVMGNTYKVRVGRSDSNGSGTFSIIYEHLAVEIRSGFFPDPPGAATCYDFATNFQRTPISYSVGSTRWKFVDGAGTVYGPYTGTSLFNFGQAPELCETIGSVTAFVEVQANDADCGTIWWGYSVGRNMIVCTPCPTITSPVNNSTYCGIYSTAFTASYVGANFQYQFRFITDNGQTEFITPWSAANGNNFLTSTLPFSNYFRYGKTYSVYVRAKRCATNPAWCGPYTFYTCSFPYANFTNTNAGGMPNYCVWRNKPGPQIETGSIPGMDQYRFRLMPVNPCASNPFLPTGASITTGWGNNNFFYPASYPIPLGQVYILQAQCRVVPSTFTNPYGQLTTIPGQQSDWGWPCFVGFRNSSSPSEGSTITCCSFPTPSSMMLPEEYLGEHRWTEFYELEEEPQPVFDSGKLSIIGYYGNEISIKTSESLLIGDGIIEIYELNGRLIHSMRIAAIHENEVATIATREELANGIYLITLTTPQGRVTEKLLIAR